jgi:general stress protein 26
MLRARYNLLLAGELQSNKFGNTATQVTDGASHHRSPMFTHYSGQNKKKYLTANNATRVETEIY